MSIKFEDKKSSVSVVSKLTRIAVLCGGPSSEADVSRRSGRNCYESLKRMGYEHVMLIEVDKNIAEKLKDEEIEVAFIALHGKYGEDGAIQGLLDILEIPYTGSRLKAMAVTIDKDLTKRLLKDAGLPVLPWQSFDVTDTKAIELIKSNSKELALPYPLMVKPLCEGSSVGMSKVEKPEELDAAIEAVAKVSRNVMVEAFITGADLTVGVLEKMTDTGSEFIATPILELRSKSKAGWYDFEAKYTKGLTEFVLPAEISQGTTHRVQELAKQAHKVLGCHGVSRVDFVLDKSTDQPYILEVNTIPGMTDVSDLPAQCQTMGMNYDELVEFILQSAM